MQRNFSISAPNQEYTPEFLKKLREKHLVIFDGKACHAIRIIPRHKSNPLFEILEEDDGHLFSCSGSVDFDMYWTDSLIKQLNDAKKYWELNKHSILQK